MRVLLMSGVLSMVLAATAAHASIDPVSPNPNTGANFNRYSYANNNPYRFIDPDGRDGQLLWTAPNQVTLTVPYLIGLGEGAHLAVTPAEINAAVAQNFSGTVDFNGASVTVTAQAVMGRGPDLSGGVNFIKVVKDTQGVTGSGRSETNAIGGNRVTVGGRGSTQAATANTIAHELGHSSGAGDQYKGGVDVMGNIINTESTDSSGIMKSLNGGSANQQTLREILRAPTNTNRCAPGVRGANGGC